MRHINISSLWIQEKQDLHQLEMRKVLGTENPADLMTKYLTRSVIDTHLEFLSQRRESGRARSGLNIQGAAKPTADTKAVGPTPSATSPNNARANPGDQATIFIARGSDIRGALNSSASPPCRL